MAAMLRRALLDLLLHSCLAAVVAAQSATVTDAAVTAALQRAGDHRAELEAALAAVPDAQRSALRFLVAHMPDADLRSLSRGFLLQQVALACAARGEVPWGKALDEAMFANYVLPYAQANEAREDWRSGFKERFLPRVADCKTPGEAALVLNRQVFAELNVHYSTARKAADQCPSQSIAQGKASCTGLSILLADACRAVCVPARLISVKWPHKPGNHTWVECWDGTAWRFVGADEPDPKGFDHAWFTGDAARCQDADAEHRIHAVSFADTGTRFHPGWGRNLEAFGVDVTDRYAAPQDPQGAADAAVSAQLDRFFAADAAAQAKFEFDRNLDLEVGTSKGDARLRALAFAAWRRAPQADLRAERDAKVVKAFGYESPYTVKTVGERPARGYGLVIAMHGGGNAPQELNDSQWRHMQIYYKDHPEHGGYRYVALRAPTNEWNGFYTDYVYPLIERLIRQFVLCDDVDPDRVYAIGYSHGGYGAFAIGPKLPDLFAAVHASASAPTDGETSAVGLRHLRFSFMVGGKDTAYGRRVRCEKFAARLQGLRGEAQDIYPTTFELIEKNGHTGLPDRDKLATLLQYSRQLMPKDLTWELTDPVVQHHYWLWVEAPAKGQRIDAGIDGQQITVELQGRAACELHLDARLCDLGQPITVTCGGASRVVTATPSLRTLCQSLLTTADPQRAWTAAVTLP